MYRLLFVFMPVLSAAQITRYLYNVSFDLQITIPPSAEASSCEQLTIDPNALAINDVYQSQLTSYPLFESIFDPQTYFMDCTDDAQIRLLFMTYFTVTSAGNRSDALSTFYQNSLEALQDLYPSYALMYKNQDSQVKVYEQIPSTTTSFNSSAFYTTNQCDVEWFKFWELCWWTDWHDWKIFGCAAVGAISCLICSIFCYVCRNLKCSCAFQDTHYKSHKLPTEDPEKSVELSINHDGKQPSYTEIRSEPETEPETEPEIELILSPNRKVNKAPADVEPLFMSEVEPDMKVETDPNTAVNKAPSDSHIFDVKQSVDESELSDSEIIYENPDKFPNSEYNSTRRCGSNNAQNADGKPKYLIESMNRKGSISVPPIPESPHEGKEPILSDSSKARESNELLSVHNLNEENKFNECVGIGQGLPKFNDKSFSKCSVSQSFPDSTRVGGNEMFYKYKPVFNWFSYSVGLNAEDKIKYFHLFIDHGWDTLQTVRHMRYDDLEKLGIKKEGHTKELVNAIHNLKLSPVQSLPPNSNSSVSHEYHHGALLSPHPK